MLSPHGLRAKTFLDDNNIFTLSYHKINHYIDLIFSKSRTSVPCLPQPLASSCFNWPTARWSADSFSILSLWWHPLCIIYMPVLQSDLTDLYYLFEMFFLLNTKCPQFKIRQVYYKDIFFWYHFASLYYL